MRDMTPRATSKSWRWAVAPQGHHFLELRIVVGGRRRRRILCDGGVRGRARSGDRLAGGRLGDAVESRRFSSARPGEAPDAEAHFSRGDTTGLVWPLLCAAERQGVWPRSGFACLLAGDLPGVRRQVRLSRNAGAWQRIAELAIGNPRLTLALALAFSGPVASLLGVEAAGIQLVGEPGGGKSGIAAAVGSVWGGREREAAAFLETWNQTKHTVDESCGGAQRELSSSSTIPGSSSGSTARVLRTSARQSCALGRTG